jgi:type I restriction enzyme S subunit
MSDVTIKYIAQKIPTGWVKYRLSGVATIQNGYPFESSKFTSDAGHPLVRIRDVMKGKTELRYDGEWVESATVNDGDTLVGMDGDFNVNQWNGGRSLLNQRVCAIRSKSGFNNEFLRYYLPIPLKVINDLTYSTTVKHLSSQDIGRIEFYAPKDMSGQEKIVSYLDVKTQTLDKILTAKNHTHTHLSELRRAIITNAVLGTGGATMSTSVKNTWVGATPDHWKITKLSHVARIKTGGTPSRENLDYWTDGNIPWLASGEVNKGIIATVDNHITPLGMANSNATILPIDTVMIALNGQGKTKGMAALLRVPATCNQSLAGVICDKDKINPRYLYYYLKSKYSNIRGIKGEARDGLNLDIIGSISVPLPPMEEQLAIIEQIERRINKIDKTEVKLSESIKLLEEYRSSLISNVVGGKVEV